MAVHPGVGPADTQADRAWAVGVLAGTGVGVAAVAAAFGPPFGVAAAVAVVCAGIAGRELRWRTGLAVAEELELPPEPQPRPRSRDEAGSCLLRVTPLGGGPALPLKSERADAAPSSPREPRPAPGPPAQPTPAVRSLPAHRAAERAYQRGLELQRSGDDDRAARALQEAMSAGNRLAAIALGRLLHSRGDIAGAANAYRRAAGGRDSLAATAGLSLGSLLDAKGDLEGAADAYRQAAATGGVAGQSAEMLLRWLEQRRRPEAA